MKSIANKEFIAKRFLQSSYINKSKKKKKKGKTLLSTSIYLSRMKDTKRIAQLSIINKTNTRKYFFSIHQE